MAISQTQAQLQVWKQRVMWAKEPVILYAPLFWATWTAIRPSIVIHGGEPYSAGFLKHMRTFQFTHATFWKPTKATKATEQRALDATGKVKRLPTAKTGDHLRNMKTQLQANGASGSSFTGCFIQAIIVLTHHSSIFTLSGSCFFFFCSHELHLPRTTKNARWKQSSPARLPQAVYNATFTVGISRSTVFNPNNDKWNKIK